MQQMTLMSIKYIYKTKKKSNINEPKTDRHFQKEDM